MVTSFRRWCSEYVRMCIRKYERVYSEVRVYMYVRKYVHLEVRVYVRKQDKLSRI